MMKYATLGIRLAVYSQPGVPDILPRLCGLTAQSSAWEKQQLTNLECSVPMLWLDTNHWAILTLDRMITTKTSREVPTSTKTIIVEGENVNETNFK